MSFDQQSALSVAARIADHLCDTALHHDGHCTWLGTTQDAEDGSDEVDFAYGTIGPDLYGGVSGVALFLAELHRRTGDGRARATALAGMKTGLRQIDAIPQAARTGFYSGQVGIAYAAVVVARLLEREDFEARGLAILHRLGGEDRVVVDFLSGGTGSIAPLLVLAERVGAPSLRDLATRLGQQTIAAAVRSGDGWSWPVEVGGIEAARPLTGLSHGAAGIGSSLLELGCATGAAEAIDAAHQAFRYENRWFRPAEANWPDFRDDAGDDAPGCEAWCHGAPGIGLTRLRAVELGFEQYRPDAEAAIRTTRQALANRDQWIDGDCSLCHGLAGLGEVLRYGSRVLGDDEVGGLVGEAAAAVAGRFGLAPSGWPCGVRRGSNPSLMIGLAGIGHFFLGLADPTVPSVVLVRPG